MKSSHGVLCGRLRIRFYDLLEFESSPLRRGKAGHKLRQIMMVKHLSLDVRVILKFCPTIVFSGQIVEDKT